MPETPNQKTQNSALRDVTRSVSDVRSLRRYLPDADYWRRATRRQWQFCLFVFTIFIVSFGLWHLLAPPSYRVSAAAIYDDRELIAETRAFMPSFAAIATNFERQFASEEFLSRMGSITPSVVPWHEKISQMVSKWENPRHSSSNSGSTTLARQQHIAQQMRHQIVGKSDDLRRILTVIATAQSVDTAKQLAQHGLETFIVEQLTTEANLANQRLIALRKLKEQEATRSQSSRDGTIPNQEIGDPVQPSPTSGSEEQLRHEEQKLELKVQRLKASLAAELSSHNARRAALEADLARLGTQLTPSHPDYIAKQEELSQFPRSADTRALDQEITDLTNQLNRLRTEMRQLGLAPGYSEPPRVSSRLLANLDEQIKIVEFLAEDLQQQMTTPQKRTYLRTIGPTIVEVNNGRDENHVVFRQLLISIMAGLFASFVRDIRSQRAEDTWKIRLQTRTQIIAEVSARWLRRYPRLTRLDILDLRRAATPSSPKRKRRQRRQAATLFALRQAACKLGRGMDGSSRPTLLLPAGLDDKTADAFLSIFNLYADESGGKTLIIDLAYRDPLVGPLDGLPVTSDFTEFLAGKSPWRNVRIEANELYAAALVPPPALAAIADGSTRLIRAELMQRLFASLATGYQHIFVRGMPPDQPLVNQELIATAGEVIIVCDARNTTMHALKQVVSAVPASKLQGIILIAT